MKRVGIMGGTFNPIHNAHLIIAEHAYNQLHLDEILFMPSNNPPHKKKSDIAEKKHRKKMVELAIQGNSHFHFSPVELNREGTTFTVETLSELKKVNSDTSFYFILGEDSLLQFENWRKPEIICTLCNVVVARRNPMQEKELFKQIDYLNHKYQISIQLLELPVIEISSQMIRENIKNNLPFRYYCPEAVFDYICAQGLYECKIHSDISTNQSFEISEIREILKRKLSRKRFEHTLGVQYTAASMSMSHGYDIEKASLAGLLHDCTKYLSKSDQYEAAQKYGIKLSEAEQKNAALVHAKTGACIAENDYKITDSEILQSIRYHTTGRPGMTVLEKIIFIADYIEPERAMDCSPYPLKEIRKVAFHDLNKAMVMILENTKKYITECSQMIDETSLETLAYYKNKLEKEGEK